MPTIQLLIKILHLCYDLAKYIHTKSSSYSDQSDKKTIVQVQFWMDQLKRSIQIRYGKLGNNIESVRSAMQHSKVILRQKHGIDCAKYHFI